MGFSILVHFTVPDGDLQISTPSPFLILKPVSVLVVEASFSFLTSLLSCLGLLLYGALAMKSGTLGHLEVVLRSHLGMPLSYFLTFVWINYT